jgi:response regulator RpfG family c-di-GMP phosphodiesterase
MDHNLPTNIETALHRILVVDDEEIVLVALRETLKREGYEVVTASSALDALEIVKKQQFSVILSDHQMPVITGLEFLAQVKQIQPDATRILITAVLSLNTVIDAINKGEIYRFIVKPWLREELLATVKNAVQRYELICKNAVLQATTLAMNEKLKELNKSLQEQLDKINEQNNKLAELNQALELNLQRSVNLCLRTMETFYPVLGSQARRVYELCKSMANVLSLPEEERKLLEISAWLYDIGLVGVPRQLIKKWQQSPDSLNEAEKAIIEQHPILGQELVNFVHPLESIGLIIRAHHERFDGTGYPDKLSGENLPWLARLLAVAVGYAESHYEGEDAISDIKLASGSAYDPEAVRVFLRAFSKTVVPRKEKEVLLSELRPGMVLSRGIYTANGLLLIPEGQVLSAAYIDKLMNHNRLNPICQSLLVYC